MRQQRNVPGSLWTKGGRWYWAIKLPGESRRHNHALGVPSSRPRSSAVLAARRILDAATDRTKSALETDKITVAQLCAEYCAAMRDYYRTTTAVAVRIATNVLRGRIGSRRVADITHGELLCIRDEMARAKFCVSTINLYIGFWRRMFRWGLDHGRISSASAADLTMLGNIRPGRSPARDPRVVDAATRRAVKAACAHLPPQLADMVRLQELCGMRTGELCRLSWEEIERRADGIWVYRPTQHKNKHRGLPRAVVIGPIGQRLLMRQPSAGGGAVFRPDVAVAQRRAAVAAGGGDWVEVVRRSAAQWDSQSFGRAVKAANTLAIAAGEMPAEERFTSTMLRHSCATRVRRWFGVRAARSVLGHNWGRDEAITDRYSRQAIEDEMIASARPAMLRLG